MLTMPNLNIQVRNFSALTLLDLIPARDFISYSLDLIPSSSILPEAEIIL